MRTRGRPRQLFGLTSGVPRRHEPVTLGPQEWFDRYQVGGAVRLMSRNPPEQGQDALYFHSDRPDLVSVWMPGADYKRCYVWPSGCSIALGI